MPETGQPLADNAAQATPDEAQLGTETQIDGESVGGEAQTPELEEKYRGKSVAEIAKMHREAEAKLGKQSAELGDTRKKLDEYSAYLQRVAWEREMEAKQQRAAQPAPPPHPRPEPDYPAPTRFDWDKPEQSSAQIADLVARQRMAQMYQGLRQEQSQTQMEQARMIAPLAQNEAMRRSPHLFKDVQDKVSMAMDMGVRQGLIRPQDVANPATWEMVAWQLQGVQNQYRFQGTVNPVSPTMTETPSGIRSNSDETEEVTFPSDLNEAISKGWKEDPKKVAKALAEDRRKAKIGR